MANSTKFWPWPTVHRGAPCACGVQVNLVVLVIVLRRVRRHRALAASVKHRGVHSVWWVRFVPLVAYDDVKIYEVLSAWKITWFTVVFDQRPIRVAVLRSRQTVTWVHASWQTMLFSVNMINNIYHYYYCYCCCCRRHRAATAQQVWPWTLVSRVPSEKNNRPIGLLLCCWRTCRLAIEQERTWSWKSSFITASCVWVGDTGILLFLRMLYTFLSFS